MSTSTVYSFVAREQKFTFTLSGLLPLTVHSFYFERQKVAAGKLKPVGGVLGGTLKTDENGKITFDFFYDSGITADKTSLEQAQSAANLIAGNKEVVLAAMTYDTLPDTFESTSFSYYRGHIRLQAVFPASEVTG